MLTNQIVNPSINTTSTRIFRDERFWQVLSGGRTRINSDVIPAIQIMLLLASEQYVAVLRRTHRGLDASQRAALRGQKKFARAAMKGIDAAAEWMLQKHDLTMVEQHMRGWLAAMAQSRETAARGEPDAADLGGEGG